MEKKYFDITVMGDGAIVDFTVDEETAESFDKWFDGKTGVMKFLDQNDKGMVKLRNSKLIGYKKREKEFIPIEMLESIKEEIREALKAENK